MAVIDTNYQVTQAFNLAYTHNYPFGETFQGASYISGATDDTIYGTNDDIGQSRFYQDPNDPNGGGFYVFDQWFGNDGLSGGGGNDQIFGYDGNDVLAGGDGGDTLQGNANGDNILGDAGNDVLYGGQGADILRGGDGNDFISGDLYPDTMYGGAGADTIYISSSQAAADGSDYVLDFNYAEGDRVRVAAGVSYTLVQSGADVVVQLSGGNGLIVANQTLSALPADWIYT